MPDREEKRKKIRQDLLDQLERNGVVGEQYIDLVDAYMHLWDTFHELTDDIEEKGVSIKWQNGENQFGYKKNDSVAERNKTVNQMLKVLKQLGLEPSPSENTPVVEEM